MIDIVGIDEFENILNELYEFLPDGLLKGLNLGIIIEEQIQYHDESIGDDLVCLGAYKIGPMGRSISIYYGSFMKLFWHLDREQLKERVRETLYHEITHHLESLAGIRDLEVEDEIFIRKYKEEYRD